MSDLNRVGTITASSTDPGEPADTSVAYRDRTPDADHRENPLKRFLRSVDRVQRSNKVAAFTFGVIKKYGDDNGGSLAALLTYYGFLSVFPLLLVLVTVLGIVVGSHAALEKHILNSALSQFPVIGNELGSNIKTLHEDSPAGLTIGLLGLIWGSTGVCQSAQYAMAQVWNIPKLKRPGFLPRLGRSALLLAVGAIFLIVSSGLAGVATFSGSRAVALRIGGGVLVGVVDIALFVIVFRILTPASIPGRDLWPGAVVAGIVWAVLQTVGGFLMDHELRHSSQVYGFFAIVLGTLWWIYLAAQIVVYSAELNVVRVRRLYPRSLVQPPLTAADRTALAAYALVEQRRPEVSVSASDADPDLPAPAGAR
jgi:YihY family inner membrane protein